MPKITSKGGPSFDPQQPVDPVEAADPRSPVPDPNAARERPGEDGTGFAKYRDDVEVEYEGRSPEVERPERPSLNANKPDWVAFALAVNDLVETSPIDDPTADDVTKQALVDAYRKYGQQQPGTPPES